MLQSKYRDTHALRGSRVSGRTKFDMHETTARLKNPHGSWPLCHAHGPASHQPLRRATASNGRHGIATDIILIHCTALNLRATPISIRGKWCRQLSGRGHVRARHPAYCVHLRHDFALPPQRNHMTARGRVASLHCNSCHLLVHGTVHYAKSNHTQERWP